MKVNSQFLLDRLTKRYSVYRKEEGYGLLELQFPVLWEQDCEIKDKGLYVITWEEYETCGYSFEGRFLFLIIGKKAVTERLSRQSWFIKTEDSMTHFYNYVQTIFSKFKEWEVNMLDCCLHSAPIRNMLETATPFLEHPMMVIGMDFSVVASTLREEGGTIADFYKFAHDLKEDITYNQVRELDGYFFYPGITENGSSICVNIKKDGVTTYRLLLLYAEEYETTAYGPILSQMAELIEGALRTHSYHQEKKDRRLHAIFKEILTQQKADYVVISQKLEVLGWYSSSEYLVVLFQLSYLDRKNLTIQTICDYIENTIKGSCAFEHEGDVVVYINLTLSDYKLMDLRRELGTYIRDSFLMAGYSRVLLGHFNLRRQYLQARTALDIGSREYPFRWIFYFNDISFEYILEQATRKLPGYMISNEKLLKLKTADENNGTEYFITLRHFLDNQLNAVKTAREMYIHRSTFLYRLEKIKSFLGTDLTNPDDVLYLMLSFRLIERENSKQ